MSLRRDGIWSPNYSSRAGAHVTHIVAHTAQGALTYQSLGNYFASPSAQVSSHVGIDDTPGVVGEYVARGDKAWTASDANPWSVQAELCAFAEWSTDEWMTHPTMLDNCARWIAEEAAAFGIPIVNIAASAQSSSSQGVCQHNDLGAMGGGHWDCGPGFPVDHVLGLAGAEPGPGPSPTPPTPTEDDDIMALTIAIGDDQTDKGRWYVTDMFSFKTYLPTAEAAAQVIWCVTASGGKVYHGDNNGPIAVSTDLLRNIPSKDDL